MHPIVCLHPNALFLLCSTCAGYLAGSAQEIRPAVALFRCTLRACVLLVLGGSLSAVKLVPLHALYVPEVSSALAGKRSLGMAGISPLQIVLLALAACSVSAQQTQPAANQKNDVVSFLAPGRTAQAGALQTLGGQNQSPAGRVRQATSPAERGQPSWGAYLTPTDEEGVSDGPTRVRFTSMHVAHGCRQQLFCCSLMDSAAECSAAAAQGCTLWLMAPLLMASLACRGA